jgi:hypothetical protein
MNNSNLINENSITIFVILLIIIISLILGSIEAFVISRLGWAKFTIALGYSFISNYISAAITAFLSLILFVVVIVVFLQGTMSCLFGCPDPKALDSSVIPIFNYITIYIFTIPTLFFLSKRLFIFAFQIRKGWVAWVYAFVSSVLTLATIIGVPILFFKYSALLK